MEIPPDEWLERVNAEFRAKNISVRERPILALQRYCRDFGVKEVRFDSGAVKHIFSWFYRNTESEAHSVGPLYTGIFYYDACFWAVDIPICYGRPELDALSSLRAMPSHVKRQLVAAQRDISSYVACWVDCLDYAYGFDDMVRDTTSSTFGMALLKNADKELRAAISQLLEHRPNSKAGMSSRMAAEIFFKSFLALKSGLSEQQAKSLGHNLDELVNHCQAVAPQHDIISMRPRLSVFPSIHDRYTGQDIPDPMLWKAYSVAQYIGTATIRSFTDRDSRAQLQVGLGK